MRLPYLGAVNREQVEEWVWRLVLVGVVCDFLYLGWLVVRTIHR